MNIGLIDVDSHNFPNLCLMKLAAYHKAQGDRVEWYNHDRHHDIVYQSKVFDDTYSKDIDFVPNATHVIKGGTGYGLENILPDAVEHIMPDYSLYGIKDTAYGFLTRGCPRHCAFCIVGDKEGLRSQKVADLSEFWSGQPNIELLDPNLLACKDRMELLDQLIDSRAVVNINQGFDIRLTNEEIADNLYNIAGHGAAISGSMARIPVPGTPLGDAYPVLSDERISQIIAVIRLACGNLIPDICVHPASELALNSGANVTVIETGAVPRDGKPVDGEWRKFTAEDAMDSFRTAGYTVIRN